ncbi:MAG: hypothetical protein ACREXR_05205 [Gammaproteobacteria bacterium]
MELLYAIAEKGADIMGQPPVGTDVPMACGFCHLVAIIKGYSRRCWFGACDCMEDASFCLEAVLRHGRPEISPAKTASSPENLPSAGCGPAMDSKALAGSGRLNFDAVYYRRRIDKLAA